VGGSSAPGTMSGSKITANLGFYSWIKKFLGL
jgi:hypothetical protein